MLDVWVVVVGVCCCGWGLGCCGGGLGCCGGGLGCCVVAMEVKIIQDISSFT